MRSPVGSRALPPAMKLVQRFEDVPEEVLCVFLRKRGTYTFIRMNVFFVAWPLIISQEELQFGLNIVEEALAEIDTMLTA